MRKKKNQDYRKEVDRRQKFTQRSGEQADALGGQGAGQQARGGMRRVIPRHTKAQGRGQGSEPGTPPFAIGSLYTEQPRVHGG